MNTANLQLEGLLLALAAVLRTLRRDGLLTDAALTRALDDATQAADGDMRRHLVTPANQNAIRFPIDFLRRAALASEQENFTAIASEIGRNREGLTASPHPAGPHAREDLTEPDATPGAGTLPDGNDGRDVDPGTG